MIHHLVFRGILQDDPFFIVEKVEGRYCTDAVQAFDPYRLILVESVVPVGRIYRHVFHPGLDVLIDIDIDHCKETG